MWVGTGVQGVWMREGHIRTVGGPVGIKGLACHDKNKGLIVEVGREPRSPNSQFISLSVSLFLATLRHVEFPGQESDLSHSCKPSHCHSNTGSLTHCVRTEIEPASQCSQDAANLIAPQKELQSISLFCVCVFSDIASDDQSLLIGLGRECR